jgi:oligopeptide/dipeptide ABC transporter ATP-binding protein
MLLNVEGLNIDGPDTLGRRSLVRDVNLHVDQAEVLGIAGESGSGKTLTALSVLGLLPPGLAATGSIRLAGRELMALPERDYRSIRGARVAMVSQDPRSSLHPLLRVETLLCEHMRRHLGLDTAQARDRALRLLDDVRIPNPEAALGQYPWQFSGGMRQRIALAIALACDPDLLIADEPTTALDVTVQAGILRLLRDLRRARGLSIIVITHDMGVMSALADRIVVMLDGRVVEEASKKDLFDEPRHPYTRKLLTAARADLAPAPNGTPETHRPALTRTGCHYQPRCPSALDLCAVTPPERIQLSDHAVVMCRPEIVEATT